MINCWNNLEMSIFKSYKAWKFYGVRGFVNGPHMDMCTWILSGGITAQNNFLELFLGCQDFSRPMASQGWHFVATIIVFNSEGWIQHLD